LENGCSQSDANRLPGEALRKVPDCGGTPGFDEQFRMSAPDLVGTPQRVHDPLESTVMIYGKAGNS
jgi:hypothetical protein